MAAPRKTGHTRRWYRPSSLAQSVLIRPRVYLAAMAGAATFVLLPGSPTGSVRAAIAGDAGAAVYLMLALRTMMTCDSPALRARAARQDDSAVAILVLVLLAIGLSFSAIVGVLSEAKQASTQFKFAYIGLATSSIMLSWLVTQVVFTFHYAHEFYRPDDAQKLAGGLSFPHDAEPDYWDFFYFATSIGAASQTSDVSISTKGLRRLVTLHAVISFFFNTAVLALAINIGAGLI